VKWIRSQPWCDGKIGGWGGSYVGYTQWAISDVLDAITPELTSANIYELFYPGGIFSLATAFNWGLLVDAKTVNPVQPDKILASYNILPLSLADDSTTKDIAFINEWLMHENYDDYWRAQNHRNVARAPAFSIAGWYDIFLMPQILDFQFLSEDVRSKSRLIIGPWCHGKQAWENKYGGGEKKGNKTNWMAGFFNENLRNQVFDYADPVFKNKIYNLFVMERNEYFGCDTWPPRSVEFTPYYLGPDGYLSPQLPEKKGKLEYFYDPADPFPNKGGTFLGVNVGAAVQNENMGRHDQLVFETTVLTDDLILLGPLTATLYVTSGARSTDFYVSIHDVMPNDTIINIQENGKKVELTPGINKVDLSLWATGYQLYPDHKLRVVITSALFPRFNRNLNSGEPIFSATNMKKVQQAVYYGAHPSSVTLSILRWKSGEKFEE
jgi:putative CocE/NonD family hydrolase